MASETKVYEKPNHFRYERKFTTRWPYQRVIDVMKHNTAQFREIYAERYINNIYFDDLDFANYFEYHRE